MSKSRYLYHYQHLVCDTLILSRRLHTPMGLPHLKGLVCVASSSQGTSTLLTKGALELTLGQRATTTLAKRSIAAFNLRENTVVSCMVTLRNNQLYAFLDLLITFVMAKWEKNLEKRRADNTRQKKGISGLGLSEIKQGEPHKLAETISLGLGNFLEFPQLEPFFPQFESAKGCNINIMINPKSIKVKPLSFSQIWGF